MELHFDWALANRTCLGDNDGGQLIMSAKMTSIVWEHSKATGAHRLVMLALADLANDDGWCDPRIARLGDWSACPI